MEQRQANVSNVLQIKHRQGLFLALHEKQKTTKDLALKWRNSFRFWKGANVSQNYSVDLGAELYKCPKFIGKTTRIMA